MVSRRTLPAKNNTLIEDKNSPQHDILVERRRLGRTNLDAKPGQVGISDATKPKNLGIFDYAHLRVPLPKNLSGSGVFTKNPETKAYPESYFLMRRSSDGYLSATGMFKAAFPWATIEQDHEERIYHKSLPQAAPEEVAGNVWIHPEQALELAEEYGMRSWITALIDPEPIMKGNKGEDKDIATPPRFGPSLKSAILPPPSGTRSVRKREKRSVSPSKIATPSRKIASPRKRTSRKKKDDDSASVASEVQEAVQNGVSKAESVAESLLGESPAPATNGVVANNHVQIKADVTTIKKGDTEKTETSVVFDLPAGQPNLPLPKDPESLLAQAKEMVELAVEADKQAALANGTKPATRKRKASELVADDEAAEASGAAPESELIADEPAAKKNKVLHARLRQEKVKTRAMIGLAFTVAIGAATQYFF